MPCYCDIPEETDQIEIERRCKVNMYFDVQLLMTPDQRKIAEENKISQFPLPDVNSALCKLCNILKKEQMEQVPAYYYQIKWTHKKLYDWYIQHCKDDKEFNK